MLGGEICGDSCAKESCSELVTLGHDVNEGIENEEEGRGVKNDNCDASPPASQNLEKTSFRFTDEVLTSTVGCARLPDVVKVKLPSLPPLPLINNNTMESKNEPVAGPDSVALPSNNPTATTDSEIIAPAANDTVLNGEILGELGARASDSESVTLEQLMDEGIVPREEGKNPKDDIFLLHPLICKMQIFCLFILNKCSLLTNVTICLTRDMILMEIFPITTRKH